MANDLRIALVTSLNDRLVGPLRRALDEVERNLREVEESLTNVSRSGEQAGRALGGIKGPAEAARQVGQLARETERSMTLAQRLQSAWNKTGAVIKGVGAGIAAFQAARYVVSGPLQDQRTYGRQLADAANVAYSDRDLAGRQSGMRDLDAIVTESLRTGGGKREDVLGALNDMLASGTMDVGAARKDLPQLARYASASGADVTQLSTIAVRARQNGMTDTPRTLDMALAAGQAGGFELKDMAKWVPQLLAAGRQAGITGYEGYARILASAQASVITSGTKDEAGNNLLNLLLKLNSSDTAQDAKKLGIDLPGSLSAARGKGVNALDAFVNLADQLSAKDSRLVKLRQQAASASTPEEKRSTLQAQADILQGSVIGKIIQDRQALMALVAELNNRSYVRNVQRTVEGANGQYGAQNFALVASTADYKVQQQENEQQIAQTKVLGDANAGLGKLAEAATDLYRRYPDLASAFEGTKISLTALTAAAGAAAGTLALIGLAKSAPALAGAAAAGAAGSAGAAGAGASAGALASRAGGALAKAGRAAGWLGLASQLFWTSDEELDTLHKADAARQAKAVGGGRGKIAGATAEMLQSQAPAAGSPAAAQQLADATRALQALRTQPLQVQLFVDGRQLQTSVNSHNASDARRQ